MCKLLCESFYETYSGPGWYLKKSDNVNIFWTLNLVLPLLGYPTLNGGVAPSWCAFRCQVQCRLTTRYVISTALIDCIDAFVCTCIKCVKILLLLFFMLHTHQILSKWNGAHKFGIPTNIQGINCLSPLPSPQQPFTKSTTTAFLSFIANLK